VTFFSTVQIKQFYTEYRFLILDRHVVYNETWNLILLSEDSELYTKHKLCMKIIMVPVE